MIKEALRYFLLALNTLLFVAIDGILWLTLAASTLICMDEFADRWKTIFVERDVVGRACGFLKGALSLLIKESGLQEQFSHVPVFDQAFIFLLFVLALLSLSTGLRIVLKKLLLEPSAFSAVSTLTRILFGSLLSFSIAVLSIPISIMSTLRDSLVNYKRARTSNLILIAPGQRWLKFAQFFFSPKTVDLEVRPTLADWHNEYFNALQDKKTAKSRWICVRYNFSMVKVLWLSKLWEIVERVFKLVKK